ncbi:response regulator transcription factor [Agitococcus lubricus]|uniref:DNA-binding response OmpR family regulator n=1 Tax=Agitococcus lubricus TaxID=1077255 RepID=A0A2T5J1N7_9GAMM|nr:response regulator transcription factor [Agitococcus lubricus]PTQ90354.1 DNA-binding response OmpR family regulator [Agitococcus lubricus]
MNILIIEDDLRVSDFLERGLRAEGYRIQVAHTAQAGIALARDWASQHSENEAVVIILDVMLPDMTGFSVCQTLRTTGIKWPILMLSALGNLEDRISGLRLGADDYLVKPFAFEELLARIEALFRRGQSLSPSMPTRLMVADLLLDRDTMRVTRAGKVISLTARELALLELLMSSPGRLFSRERILSNVWGVNEDPLTNVVDVYIRRLRHKIDGTNPNPLIHTQRGLGYRLESVNDAVKD